MVSVTLGQLRPPSKGVPLSMAIAAFGSNRWMSRIFLSSTAPGKPGGIIEWAGMAKPSATLTTFSRSMAWPSARRTFTLSKGGLVT
jgi:hypothetical protein